MRVAEGLSRAIGELEDLNKKLSHVRAPGASQYNPGWHEALSLYPMTVVAEAVVRAALVRQESRGAHTRLDFEGEREEWGKVNVFVRKEADGSMGVRKVERGAPPPDLAAIAFTSLDDLEGGVHV